MSEFQKIAECLSSYLKKMKDDKGVHADELSDIIVQCTGKGKNQINCYPGVSGIGCCDLSFFISLKSPSYTRGRGHLDCKQAMEKIVQHMQGSCFQKTRIAIFLTDNWDAAAFEKWRANLEDISHHAHIEIYLLTGQTVSEIKI